MLTHDEYIRERCKEIIVKVGFWKNASDWTVDNYEARSETYPDGLRETFTIKSEDKSRLMVSMFTPTRKELE